MWTFSKNPKSVDFASRWPGEAASGRRSFIVRRGLRYAVEALILIWLGNWALGWDQYPWSGRMSTAAIVFQLVVVLIGGILMGFVMWNANNRRYREMTAHPG